MAKTSVLDEQEDKELFDFSDFAEDSLNDDTMLGMLSKFIEAYHFQQQTAVELTRMVVEKCNSGNLTEEKILSTFKRVSQTLSEISPIKEFFEKMHD